MTTLLDTDAEVLTLRQRYLALQQARPMRVRDAAQELGVTEVALVAMRTGEDVLRLRADFPGLMARLHELGRVMALTRNAAVVHEKDGQYLQVSQQGQVGMALGEEIDLRLFYKQWQYGFALTECEPGSALVKRSLQFFDRYGDAVHKIYLRPHSDVAAFERLLALFRHPDQSPGLLLPLLPPPVSAAALDDAQIDVSGLRTAWAAMTDTHEFFGLLKKFKLDRHQALRLVDRDFAYPVTLAATQQMLTLAAAQQTPIMVFVGNRGMIQIHSGAVHKIAVTGAWLNVLDPGFNLHLRQPDVASAWVVRKPTSEGVVTSLELFDQQQENIAMFFGQRKPGVPELSAWRSIVAQLEVLP